MAELFQGSARNGRRTTVAGRRKVIQSLDHGRQHWWGEGEPDTYHPSWIFGKKKFKKIRKYNK
jgi:hypothetical protein